MAGSLIEAPQNAKVFLGQIKGMTLEERADRAIKLSGEVVDLLSLGCEPNQDVARVLVL